MLTITGDEAEVEALLELLGAAAGLTLSNAESGHVAIAAETEPTRSLRLREVLREMIDSDRPEAKVQLAGNAVHFGIFGAVQKLNVATVLGLEQGVPGFGVVVAIHEIFENYTSWQPDGRQSKYGPAHARALELEGVVFEQLTGRPGRRAAVASGGDKPSYALDMQSCFVVLASRPPAEVAELGRFTATLRDREPLNPSEDLPAVPAGTRVPAQLITNAVARLKERKQATLRVTALHVDGEAAEVSRDRAEAVRNAIIVGLNDDDYEDEDGILLSEVAGKGPGADLGARRVWTNTERIAHPASGVRLEYATPSGN